MFKTFRSYALVFILGAAFALAIVYLVCIRPLSSTAAHDAERADRLAFAYGSVTAAGDNLGRDLRSAREATNRADAASANARAEFAKYRAGIEKRERERRSELEQLIRASGQNRGDAQSIADGSAGDLELAQRLSNGLHDLADGITQLSETSDR